MTNDRCTESIKHSRIKCEEKQSRFILLNPDNKKIDRIKVDGCIYLDDASNPRCDYALNYLDKTIFIELKGSNYKAAFKQILSTVKDAKFTINAKKYAVIVTSRTPRDDSSTHRLKAMFKKRQIGLIHNNSPIEKSLNEFV